MAAAVRGLADALRPDPDGRANASGSKLRLERSPLELPWRAGVRSISVNDSCITTYGFVRCGFDKLGFRRIGQDLAKSKAPRQLQVFFDFPFKNPPGACCAHIRVLTSCSVQIQSTRIATLANPIWIRTLAG